MNIVYTVLAYLLPSSAVDRAVGAITKAAAALAAAEAIQNSKAVNLGKQIDTLSAKRSTALSEAGRAARIAERLNNLTA